LLIVLKRAAGARYGRIQVSEKASMAVLIAWPATSRATGLPARRWPFTSIAASWHGTNRLGIWCRLVADLSGGRAKQNGWPSPVQLNWTVSVPAVTVSL
jgi:hypothetical protein